MEAKSKLKRALETSTPFRANAKNNFETENEISSIVAVEKKQKLIVSIVEAIETIGHPRKGASYQAIKKWIVNSKGGETNSLNRMLKLAVTKGLSTGDLVRPKHCLTAVGITGSFSLPKKGAKKPLKNTVKSSETKTLSPKEKKMQEKPKEKKVAQVTGKKVPAKPVITQVDGKKAPVKNGVTKVTGKKEAPAKSVVTKVKVKKTSAKSKVTGKKAQAKSAAVPLVLNFSETESEEDVVEKDGKKTASKQLSKLKKVPATKMDSLATKAKQTSRMKKEESLKKNTTAGGKTSKAPGMKTLYAPNPKRKDLSDTELNTTMHRPIPLKSYSSDTELEISKRNYLNNKKSTKTRERKMPGKKI